MGWYTYCMDFHVRWIFLTHRSPSPTESLVIRRWVVRNPFHMENHIRQVIDDKYIAQSWRSWKQCEMDLSHNCCQHGRTSEVCENDLYHRSQRIPPKSRDIWLKVWSRQFNMTNDIKYSSLNNVSSLDKVRVYVCVYYIYIYIYLQVYTHTHTFIKSWYILVMAFKYMAEDI